MWLVLAFAPNAGLRWPPILVVPWLLGAIPLWRAEQRIVEGTRALASATSGKVGLAVIGAHLALATHFLSLDAALFLFTSGAALWLVCVAWRPEQARDLLARLAVAATATTAALATAEGLIRVTGLEHAGPDEVVLYDAEWRENALGFRSRHEVTAKNPGSSRVVVLGDSFTWGVGVQRTADVWPARLESLLAERPPPATESAADGTEVRPVQVVNLGRPGFTTANEAELLRRVGWQFEPDLVIVQFYINDALPSGPDFFHESGEYLFPRHSLLPVRFRTGAIRHTALLRFLESGYGRLRNRDAAWEALYEDGSKSGEQFAAALREIGEAGRARNVPVLFAMIPELVGGEWTAEQHPDRLLFERVARAAAGSGLAVIDLTPVFAGSGVDGSTWWATGDDPHPNASAHDLIARALAARLAETWPDLWLGCVEPGPLPARCRIASSATQAGSCPSSSTAPGSRSVTCAALGSVTESP